MKYIIDEEVCKKYNLSLNDVFGILFCKTTDNIQNSLSNLLNRELLKEINIEESNKSLYPTQNWDDIVSSVLLESDNLVPKKNRCEDLANKLRELFPKGIKTGSSAWRGNKREITLRLQKFFKLYGDKWSDDEIIDATQRYINHFNSDYTYMRILKYFIMKSVIKQDEESTHIEDISELATWLENTTDSLDNPNWMYEIK